MSEKELVVSLAGNLSWPSSARGVFYPADTEALREDFDCEQEKLFVDDDEIEITIIEIKNGITTSQILTNLDEVESLCEEQKDEGTMRIILIPQSTSWGELEISKRAFQLLMSTFDISPGFWTVMKLFGYKENADHESGGGFNEGIWDDTLKSSGLSYCVKHAAEHGRPDCHDPWSLRQIGVHHESQSKANQNTFVILNPSDALRNRLERSNGDVTPTDIHHAILHSATEQWNKYIDSLEGQCENLSKKALLSNVQAKETMAGTKGYDVQFYDSQQIQKLQDTVLRVSHMLDLNLSVYPEILKPFTPLHSKASPQEPRQGGISSLATKTKVSKLRVESLLRRIDRISTLVRSMLDTLASQALQNSSRTTAELTGLAREDAKVNIEIAKKSTQDARTLKTITILTLVYLPASFVATLLGTQYVNIRSTEGHITISVAREMWIFGVLTIILLLVTLGSWLVWEWRNRVHDRIASLNVKTMP